ncbi:hypothetical protein Rhow_002362 [Rhodococcus wratislaviensis]|uniref:Two-component system sensor kinase n=1 Tax=Rhodococcus wratislaviensis TaxID=44752 RepID=A0A402C5J9_RHOWR|nr:hypothetical protein Rhow_002362 [Rhodococcus wratislaviensis]
MAWLIVGAYITGITVAAAGTVAGVRPWWPVAVAVLVNAAAVTGLLVVSGDPLPWWAALAIGAAGPVAAALVLSVLPVPVVNPLQTWPVGSAVGVYTFLCVRGRPWWAWGGQVCIMAVCVGWATTTGQGTAYGLVISVISIGPLLMGTVFAYTIRPYATTIFRLRREATRQIADEAAAAAALSERDRQLHRLDELARPLLERIATGRPLDRDEMLQCRLLEAHLRDALRAPGLADPLITSAAQAARARGVEVVLLDDHGLDTAADDVRRRVVLAVADELHRAQSGSVTARILPPGRAQTASVLVSADAGTHRVEFGPDGHRVGPSA